MKKSRKNNPMIIDMIKDNVHVELTLWPLLLVKIVAGDDVGFYEINLFRLTQPFVAVAEICHQYAEKLHMAGKSKEVIDALKEMERIVGTGKMFPIYELKAAGWTIPDFRRLNGEIAA